MATKTVILLQKSHSTLKTVDNSNTITVYAMALFMEFEYSGGGLSETGGSHMPVAITFSKNAAGKYDLIEYWTPKDGSDYTVSIKKKFPPGIYEDALDTQKYILSQVQACYKKAVEYGKVNTGTVINKLIETICSSPAVSSRPGDYIEAHPVEYRELLYYGDYTLRYVYGEFLKGGQTGLNSHIMLSAMRELLGSEDMDIGLSATVQEWFDQMEIPSFAKPRPGRSQQT